MYYALEDKRERFNEDLIYLMYETQKREDRKLELLTEFVAQGCDHGTQNRTADNQPIPTPVICKYFILK